MRFPRVMMRPLIVACLLALLPTVFATPACGEVSAERVLRAIKLGKRYLAKTQNADGSWEWVGNQRSYSVGVTSLALLALLNSDMTLEDEPVRKALKYLRNVRQSEPDNIYEISLMIMALAAARDGQRDILRIEELARRLEDAQKIGGPEPGAWGYSARGSDRQAWPGDRSNAQYAILGLHAAAQAGVQIKKTTWERARSYWVNGQNADGGWNYVNRQGGNSYGSMTAAGISSLAITSEMLRDPTSDETPTGEPVCCGSQTVDDALERGIAWLGDRFEVGRNPGRGGEILYYLYGMERAGRLSARRFFGNADWYRRGAEYLCDQQQSGRLIGAWIGKGYGEKSPVIGTSFALLFLSKGLSPVLMQKLQYGNRPANANRGVANGLLSGNWNRHNSDVRHLVEGISGLPKWPKLVTWQIFDLNRVATPQGVTATGLQELLQAPVLFISGKEGYEFSDVDAGLFRSYVEQGGFILAVANCDAPPNGPFEQSIKSLVQKMYPEDGVSLMPLSDGHLVWRSEYLVKPEEFDLLGAEVGCRTSLIFSRTDLSCLWDKRQIPEPKTRSQKLKDRVEQGFRLGVNIVAYATGREPPNKLERDKPLLVDTAEDKIQRGLLQIAKLKHEGGWDVAPRALKNLLIALNQKYGRTATTKTRPIEPGDRNLYKYPLVYMHGRNAFNMNEEAVKPLRQHLERGGLLFADACCGSRAFDASFRQLVQQLFPNADFKRLPVTHELFTDKTFANIQTVKRRVPEQINEDKPLEVVEREVEPYLEAIEINGRLAVIYSKYDISCALERQVSVACPGYIPEDALKIAMNIVMYSLLQDANYQPQQPARAEKRHAIITASYEPARDRTSCRNR